MRWLLILILCSLPALAQNQVFEDDGTFCEERRVRSEVVALRDTLWTLSEAAHRGDVASTHHLVDRAWKQWLAIDGDLRREIKYAYPRIERQMDHLEDEAVSLAHAAAPAPNPPPAEMPTQIDLRFPGYSDRYDLFGNSGLGR